ncbi:uncharacterized protein LOC125033672 [Penaeus chinensis]|uniref:uncharacterized protein LOC125033672 n=1 Tax=Penaeus chinensis TaxID=139456 RepID=UPI001FB719FD|nr:uncharacterized protein LOC125033672 [Penaeus chinensis]
MRKLLWLLVLLLLCVAVLRSLLLQLTKNPSQILYHLNQTDPNSTDTTQRMANPDEHRTTEETIRTTEPGGNHENYTTLFNGRLEHLKYMCRARPLAADTPEMPSFKRVVVENVFEACVPYKVGSSSWENWNNFVVVGERRESPVNIIVVRNPLSRLESAYRDTFLGGGEISWYTDSWRKVTLSEGAWLDRWDKYWLPALVARGSIPPTPWFLKRLKSMSGVKSSSRLTLTTEDMQRIVNHEYRERMSKLKETFSNARFKFEEFLRFVLWCNDLGIRDYPWAPIALVCDPCKQSYDYVIHMESMNEEANHLLSVLGYSSTYEIPHIHNTRDLFFVPKYGYYKYVSKEIMRRILNIYSLDFELFGYERSF